MKRIFWLCLLISGMTWAQEKPYVILVSFDGFRHDYVDRFDLPHFKSFEKKGSHAESLIPVFPSKTFPNHYSIITGLYPAHHGLVDNYFYDPERRETYSMKAKERVTDHYFYKGTPLWRLAYQAGIKSASYFWVGSELTAAGWHPDIFYPYQESVPFEDRVDKVIEWLSLPPNDRPHFITLYFSSPDHEADDYGPVAEETRQAALKADALLGRLMDGIDQLELPVNVIVVSDHGLKEMVVSNDTYIFLDELIDLESSTVHVVNGGSQTHVYADNPDRIDSLYSYLKSKEKNFRVFKREEFPPHWHYNNARAGDILIAANPGHYIQLKGRAKFMTSVVEGNKFGAHGYDPHEVKDMHGIFYAQGPNIKKKGFVSSFENIHVYPLVAKILQIGTPLIDGDFSVLEKIYKSK